MPAYTQEWHPCYMSLNISSLNGADQAEAIQGGLAHGLLELAGVGGQHFVDDAEGSVLAVFLLLIVEKIVLFGLGFIRRRCVAQAAGELPDLVGSEVAD